MTEPTFTKLYSDFGKAFHAPLGIIFGWGAVSTVKDGGGIRRAYYDLGWTGQDGQTYQDHITEDAILKASLQYASGNRTLGEMHKSAALDALETALATIPDPAVRAVAQGIVQKGQEASPRALYDRNFMPGVTPASELRKVKKIGEVPFVFPLISSILEPLGIETEKTGLLIGAKPSPDVFLKYINGELNGFSIGGKRGQDRIVEE